MTFRPGTLRHALVLIVFLIFPMQHLAAWAALCSETAGSPCKTVREITKEVLWVLRTSPSKTKQQDQKWLKKVWDIMLPHVNTCEMAMRSLPADYLPHMTNPQKEEFTDIFSRLLVQAYSLALVRYTKSGKFRLAFDEEQIEGGDARVQSRLIASNAEYVISYRLHQEREKWLIYDISYDAVSQLESYHAQLERMGRKFAYDYQEVRRRIHENLKPALRNLPDPQVKMRLWGVCQR